MAEGVEARLKRLETRLLARIAEVERMVDENGNRVDEFITEYASERERNMFAFADQIERSDYASNLLKAHCVLLTGLTCCLVRCHFNL